MYTRSRLFHLLLVACAVSLGACAGSPPPAPPAAPAGPPALTAAQRQPFVGSYSITTPEGERIPFRIYESEGALLGQPGTETPVRMVYLGNNSFRTEGQYNYTVTFVLEGGRAARFTARSGDTVLEGVRLP